MTTEELEILKAILAELKQLRKSVDEVNGSIVTYCPH